MMRASYHALYRYIERVCGFDWRPLEAEYRRETGEPAVGSKNRQARFIRWCWLHAQEDMAAFERMLIEDVSPDGVSRRKRLPSGERVIIDRDNNLIISVYEAAA